MRAESLCISNIIHTQNIEKAKACFATREKVAFLIFLTACNLLSAPHGAMKTHDTARLRDNALQLSSQGTEYARRYGLPYTVR